MPKLCFHKEGVGGWGDRNRTACRAGNLLLGIYLFMYVVYFPLEEFLLPRYTATRGKNSKLYTSTHSGKPNFITKC
jgi:hypothetical protein